MNIKETAVNYLADRPRTCFEVRKKLEDKGFDRDDIERTVEDLLSLNYLNDTEYVIAYLNYGFSKGKGIRLIKYELHEKGVSSDDIEDGILLYEEEYGYDFEKDERIRARAQAEKICDGQVPDEKMRGRIARRLTSKGFDSSVIASVLNGLGRQGEDDEQI